MTPAELKSVRHALGLSAEGFARLVRVESGRTVRRWEAGDRDIPGPVAVIVEMVQQSPEARRLLLGDAQARGHPELLNSAGSQ